jgi:hypothetical protein
MEILRIETYAKKGIYSACNSVAHDANRFHWACDSKEHRTWHPMADEDPLLREWWDAVHQAPWYFGFQDIKQLTDWFPENRWKLFIDENLHRGENEEIGLSSYEISEEWVRIGQRQLCFFMDYAKRTSFKPFTHVNMFRKIISAIAG